MHMRMSSDDVVERLLKILAQHAAEDAEMRLAASLILYALASDHANLEYFDGPAISFLARLVQGLDLVQGVEDVHLHLACSRANGRTTPPKSHAKISVFFLANLDEIYFGVKIAHTIL